MSYYLIIVVLILAVLEWVAADRKWKIVEYFAKPATMLALLGWMWQGEGLGGSMLWFTIGVICCLVGDVFLMLPWDLFIFGLLAFLLGHLAYIVGLNQVGPVFNLWGGVVIILLVIYLTWFYHILATNMNSKGKSSLKIPVLIYSIVISLMVYSALMTWTRHAWPAEAALAASLGAVLFFASDSLLAWDRFVAPISHARLKVMMTYHFGQIGIILGAILYALSR